MARQVFISYRSEDKSFADRVCAALESENIRCWIAPRDIPIGQEWASAIVSSLDACSHFVLILSSNSTNAKQISREAELADSRGLPILTLRVEDVKPPPGLVYFLGNLQWLDAFGGNFDTAVARLAEVVKKGGDEADLHPRVEAAAPVRPLHPAAKVDAAVRETPAERTGLPPYVYALAAVVVVAIGVGVWLFTKPTHSASNPAKETSVAAQVSDGPMAESHPEANLAKDAAAFGITYFHARDSGDLNSAYAMLGPALHSKWSLETFKSKIGSNEGSPHPSSYKPLGACTLRERGAYACDYEVHYSDGHLANEHLIIANHDGTWAIANDKFPSGA